MLSFNKKKKKIIIHIKIASVLYILGSGHEFENVYFFNLFHGWKIILKKKHYSKHSNLFNLALFRLI